MPTLLGQAAGSSIVDYMSPHLFPITMDLAAGTFLVVLIGDGFGYGSTPTAVSDSQGNVYTLDSVVNEPDGDGSAYVMSSLLTTSLTTSDTLIVSWIYGTWGSAYVTAFAFDGVTGFDVAGTPIGGFGSPVTLVATDTTTASDLVIGFAAYQSTVTANDPAWTSLLTDGGDANNHLAVAYQVGDAGSYTYTTTGNSTSGGGYCAAVVAAYKAGGGGGGGGAIGPIAFAEGTCGLVRR